MSESNFLHLIPSFFFFQSTVGFGGSVALFLGFSFLTGIEIVYFFIEFILEVFVNLIPSHIITDQISVPQRMKMST